MRYSYHSCTTRQDSYSSTLNTNCRTNYCHRPRETQSYSNSHRGRRSRSISFADETNLSARFILQWRINHERIIYLSAAAKKWMRQRHLCAPPKASAMHGTVQRSNHKSRMTNWIHCAAFDPSTFGLRFADEETSDFAKLLAILCSDY